jgi:hypothetical protein
MKARFKTREGKDRSLNRLKKRQFIEEQIHKLPNEFRSALTDYNHRSVGGELQIDENEYLFK